MKKWEYLVKQLDSYFSLPQRYEIAYMEEMDVDTKTRYHAFAGMRAECMMIWVGLSRPERVETILHGLLKREEWPLEVLREIVKGECHFVPSTQKWKEWAEEALKSRVEEVLAEYKAEVLSVFFREGLSRDDDRWEIFLGYWTLCYLDENS